MPDDDRDSEDLFEDLDKFFAPIKDVDWDEPEEAAPAVPAPDLDRGDEEHVTVRSQSEPVVTVPVGDGGRGGGRRHRHPRRRGRRRGRLVRHGLPRARGRGARRPPDEEALDAIAGPAEMERPDDQPGLFAGTPVEADWLGDEEDEAERPSDEELEEAAAHFGGSGRRGRGGPPRSSRSTRRTRPT